MLNIFAQEINVWAVLLAAVLSMAIGYVWYLPQVLGDMWAMEDSGKKMMDLKPDPTVFIVMFLSSLSMALTIAWFLKATSADTLLSSLRVAFGCWLGFIVFTKASSARVSGKSWKMIAIDTGYYLVDALMMGLVFYFWG